MRDDGGDRCPDDNQILAYGAATLSPEARGSVQQHLNDCGNCRGLVAELARDPSTQDRATVGPSSYPPPMSLGLFRAGDLVADRYVVRRFVARGGMGEVYEAEDVELGECVALKAMRGELLADSGALARLKREVRVMRKVAHPSVCRIAELGSHTLGGVRVPFFTMEFIEGETLRDRIRGAGPFSSDEALPIVIQIAEALDAVHREGIIHRDLKTSNVILGKGGRAVVTDFGLATHVISNMTLTSVDFVGSPLYVAPEQVEGKKCGVEADIYSFGVVLYEMLTGAWPFSAETPLLTIVRRLTQPPVPLDAHRPDVDPRWKRVIMKCLERNPEDRYRRALDVVAELQGAVATPAPSEARSRRLRRPTKWLALALLATVLGGGGARAIAVKRASAPTLAVPGRSAVAILDLRNLAKRADVAWLSTALSEMISSELSGGELRMIAGEEVARVQRDLALGDRELDGANDTKRIRENVGADWVVTGSFTVIGDEKDGRVRVDLKLRDAGAGTVTRHLTDEGPRAALLDLVRRIGSSLRASLGALERRPTDLHKTAPRSAEGVRLYAEGVQLARQFEYALAATRLTRLVAIEPQYASGHAELASVWAALSQQEKARSEAKLAFELSTTVGGDEKLRNEALYRELSHEHGRAIEIYRDLWDRHRDETEYAAALGRVQVRAGRPQDAEVTIRELNRIGGDSVVLVAEDLESQVALYTTDTDRMTRAAQRLREVATARGARRLVALADRLEGLALRRSGKRELALTFFQRSHAMYLELGDRSTASNLTDDIAQIRSHEGNLEEAVRLHREVADVKRQAGQVRGVGVSLNNLGTDELLLGHYEQAERAFGEAMECAVEVNRVRDQVVVSNNLGELLNLRERFDEAQKSYERAGEKAALLADKESEVVALEGLGVVANHRGDVVNAVKLLDRAHSTALAFHIAEYILETEVVRASLALEQGDIGGAHERFTTLLERVRHADNQNALLAVLTGLATTRLVEGDSPGARAFVDEARAATKSLDPSNPRLAPITRLEAELLLLAGNPAKAREHAASALSSVEKQGLAGPSAMGHELLARVLAALGDDAGARAELASADAAAARSPDPRPKLFVALARASLLGGRPRVDEVKRRARSLGLFVVVYEAERRLKGPRRFAVSSL